MSAPASPALARANRRVGLATTLGAAAMVGAAFAAVPLYRMFCAATGFGGTTGVAAQAAGIQPVPGRTIRIRFDANTAPALPWQFRPETVETRITIGEKRLGHYLARNLTAAPVTGRAVYNVSPDVAGRYFIKIDCFCFAEQTLAPGETARMPVAYYVDPAILDDPVASRIDAITLSYTFYPVDKPATGGLERASNGNSLKGRG